MTKQRFHQSCCTRTPADSTGISGLPLEYCACACACSGEIIVLLHESRRCRKKQRTRLSSGRERAAAGVTSSRNTTHCCIVKSANTACVGPRVTCTAPPNCVRHTRWPDHVLFLRHISLVTRHTSDTSHVTRPMDVTRLQVICSRGNHQHCTMF